MLAIPSALQSKFEERLRNESIPNNLKGQYKKWLQYKEVAPPLLLKWDWGTGLLGKRNTPGWRMKSIFGIIRNFSITPGQYCLQLLILRMLAYQGRVYHATGGWSSIVEIDQALTTVRT